MQAFRDQGLGEKAVISSYHHHHRLLRQKAAKYHIRTQNTHTKYDTKLHIGTHIHTVKH